MSTQLNDGGQAAPVAPAAARVPAELISMFKYVLRWHDQLAPSDINTAKELIAKYEGGVA